MFVLNIYLFVYNTSIAHKILYDTKKRDRGRERDFSILLSRKNLFGAQTFFLSLHPYISFNCKE